MEKEEIKGKIKENKIKFPLKIQKSDGDFNKDFDFIIILRKKIKIKFPK